MRSGALITAQQALDHGRQVFAVPGRVDSPQSKGCHYLIKDGAKLVETTDDILEEFNLLTLNSENHREMETTGARSSETLSLSKEEQLVKQALEAGELTVDELADITNLSTSELLFILLGLEIKKIATQLPGRRYSLRI